MDVEKTIEFLLANQAGHAKRISRLENALAQIADYQVHLDKTVDRFAELTTEGFKHTDKRISDLVSAIGALIGRMPPVVPQ